MLSGIILNDITQLVCKNTSGTHKLLKLDVVNPLYVSWPTAVCMVVPHHTLLRHCTWRPISKHVVVWGLALRPLCSCRRPGDPVLVTRCFLWPQREHGTLCRCPCIQLHHS